jgi:hypothetical protein
MNVDVVVQAFDRSFCGGHRFGGVTNFGTAASR